MDWAMVAAIAAIAAVVVSGIGIGVGVCQNRKGIDISQKGLEISQKAFEISADAATEAIMARLDQNAPNVEVAFQKSDWPPVEPTVALPGLGTAQPLSVDEKWAFSRDANRQIRLTAVYTVTNHSQENVTLEFEGPIVHITGREVDQKETPIEPDETKTFLLLATATAAEWAEISESAPPPRRVVQATIRAHDSRDQGTTDEWHLELTGRPLERVPGEDSSWRLRSSGDRIYCSASPPRRRTYWRSRSEGVPLLPPNEVS